MLSSAVGCTETFIYLADCTSMKLAPQTFSYNTWCAGHSVLVSAHTSAGKTVVAEYAFAMALR